MVPETLERITNVLRPDRPAPIPYVNPACNIFISDVNAIFSVIVERHTQWSTLLVQYKGHLKIWHTLLRNTDHSKIDQLWFDITNKKRYAAGEDMQPQEHSGKGYERIKPEYEAYRSALIRLRPPAQEPPNAE